MPLVDNERKVPDYTIPEHGKLRRWEGTFTEKPKDFPSRYVFDGDLTNERILLLWLKYWLIQNLASWPDDVVANLLVHDNELWSLLGIIVSKNKTNKMFSLTWEIHGKKYTNPQKYLEAIKKELAKGSQIWPITPTKEIIECLNSKLKIYWPVDAKTRKRYQKRFVKPTE